MDKQTFSAIRRHLGKTQGQLAQLLGVSPKAVQSFEQGWRNVPVHVERQLLFLVASKGRNGKSPRPCWRIRKCPANLKENCPAWEFRSGSLCWFINGTICEGKAHPSWSKKMMVCRECEVFRSTIPQFSR